MGLSSNNFLIRCISPLSLRLVQIIRTRCTNVDARLILRLKGLKDSQSKYWPVKVGFRYTRVSLQEKCLPFLDVYVKITVGGFDTKVYRKPTFTGQYLLWESFSRENLNRNGKPKTWVEDRRTSF